MERQIRKYKRILAVEPDNKRAQSKVQEWRGKLADLTEEYDLTRKRQRESIVSAR
jgi:ribosome-interacting GTPase 1